jgi:hypothetical protein
MTDPLFGSVCAVFGAIHIRDDTTAKPENPKVTLEIADVVATLDLAQLAKLMNTLRLAQEQLSARKEMSMKTRTLPLF